MYSTVHNPADNGGGKLADKEYCRRGQKRRRRTEEAGKKKKTPLSRFSFSFLSVWRRRRREETEEKGWPEGSRSLPLGGKSEKDPRSRRRRPPGKNRDLASVRITNGETAARSGETNNALSPCLRRSFRFFPPPSPLMRSLTHIEPCQGGAQGKGFGRRRRRWQ